jgi:hypothetical protein
MTPKSLWALNIALEIINNQLRLMPEVQIYPVSKTSNFITRKNIVKLYLCSE